jgi:hypothetical protein
MTAQELKETIKRELPKLLRSDPSLRRFVLDLTRELYADRSQTENRFDRILDELQRDREEQARKWDQQNRKWDEFQTQTRQEFRQVHEEIMAQAKRFDRPIGALGERWGLQSETALRNALAGILGKSFGVEVLNVNEYHEQKGKSDWRVVF